ncbi:MAG: DUF4382 domain-containing protein [Acidobacteriota bacterium]|nr:DUF4382 domain-containing protein [Acidobacteriota bacterium]
MSDPPSGSQFDNVWVTVDGVSASTSATSDSGWQTLVSGLSSNGSINAVQLDLLHLPANGQCLLAQLGSTSSLPAGDYQQIRLQLVPNNATNVTLLSPSGEPTTNQCSSVSGWNCAMPTGGSLTILNLSSQAQTGLKIPPGQVMGGPIHVAAGSSVDINIDFNAGRSIVTQGNGQFRLDPVLVAYQVSQNLTGISGQVVQGSVVSNALQMTTTAVPGANIALEMATPPTDGSTNVDLIGNYLTSADANGNFDFCPLPPGPFDVVVNAGATGTTTGNYNATIVTGVTNGTKVTVPVVAETGGPATLTGDITATSADTTATSITADIYALQQATSSLEFAVPLLTGSTPPIAQITVACSGGNCNTNTNTPPGYSLVVPASNPLVGSFSGGNISWTLPSTSTPGYKVEATCSTSSGPTGVFSTTQNVTAATSTVVNPALSSLSNCLQ